MPKLGENRASVCVGGDDGVAPNVPSEVPERPVRTQASSIDTLLGVQDIAELRGLIPTYEHPPDEHRFLSSVLESVGPITKLPPVLFSIALEAHKCMRSQHTSVAMPNPTV